MTSASNVNNNRPYQNFSHPDNGTIKLLTLPLMPIDQRVAQYDCQQVAFSTTKVACQSILNFLRYLDLVYSQRKEKKNKKIKRLYLPLSLYKVQLCFQLQAESLALGLAIRRDCSSFSLSEPKKRSALIWT